MIKVMGITGSPKIHGNTEKLLDSFLKGAEDAGAQIVKIKLRNQKYTSCQGCNKCHKTGVCVLKDELTPVFESIMNDVDILVIASPIYSMTITAEMKALIDRTQYLWARKFIKKDLSFDRKHMERHKGIFISTAGQDNKNVFDAAFPVLKAFFNDAGFDYSLNITANAMDKYGGIENRTDILSDAENKGKETVLALKKIMNAN
ncbi:MAG: flavodoxin family protein [Methanomicrobium sp.]|nr:flavodoxin family protein [Methanomicrobium sp.]MDD4299291.1 flavodoxin family protein [Methanomicrobium sp.]